MWRETFKAMIHRAHVETAIKATRLKSCLEDHKDLINLKKAIRPTAESYRRALETLEKRFGGSARCANYYIERIAAMERINSAHKIESLVCEIDNYLESLKFTGVQVQNAHTLMILVMKKLKESWRGEFLLWINQNNKVNNMIALAEWLRLKQDL